VWLLGGCVALASPAWAADVVLPPDVLRYATQREECEHWHGEEPYDAQRRREIAAGICKSCLGIDAKLARLKRRYAGHPHVMAHLNVLAPQAEWPTPKERRSACEQAAPASLAR
jgi:hypothetical protein